MSKPTPDPKFATCRVCGSAEMVAASTQECPGCGTPYPKEPLTTEPTRLWGKRMVDHRTIEQLHASAPSGYKCSDCTIDGEACPACYRVWWQQKHPTVNLVEPLTSKTPTPHVTASGQVMWTTRDLMFPDGVSTMKEQPPSNLVAEIRRLGWSNVDGELVQKAADEIERLTAALAEASTSQLVQERIAQANLRLFAESQAERDRLTAEVEALKHDIERHLSIATTYVNANQSLADKASEDAETITRLRSLLLMARDCLPDGDYSIRRDAAKEIDLALAEVNAALNIGQETGHAKRTADETDAPLLEKVRARIDPLTEGVEIGDLNDLLPPDEPQ